MFINAHLRSVLHGFEPFVPQRTELLHQRQRLIDMTNNGVSAWADFRDAASLASTPESCWDHHNDDFGDSDNTPPTNAYHRYHQDISTAPRAQTSDYGKVTSLVGFQGQFQEQRRISTLPTYEEQMVAGLSVFDDKTSPVTGQDYQSWGHTNRHKTLPHNSNGGSSAKDFQYEQPGEPCFASLPSTVALAQPQPSYPYVNATILDESLAVNQTSPSTEYSTYSSSTGSSADSLSSVGQSLSYGQSSSASNALWDQNLQGNTNPYHVAYTLPLDGLPKQYTQQQYLDIWSDDKEGRNGWIAESAVPKYISPKQVPLERFYATSAAESSQGLQHSLSGTSKHTEDLSEYSDREVVSVVEPEVTRAMTHQQQQRHLLPDYSRSIHRSVPVLRSNDFASTKIAKRRPAEAKAGSNTCNDGHRKTAPGPSSHDNCEKAGPSPQKVPLKRIEPKPVGKTDQQTWSEGAQSSQAMHYREAKDDFLVKSKLAGMSYKDIRRQGKFTEAESTLRGRFRTLTKHKNARVRKPEWDDNDIRLLKRATRKLIQNQGTPKARIPWKQVAEYIANHGGSYHFGNATCRKKWDELQEQARS